MRSKTRSLPFTSRFIRLGVSVLLVSLLLLIGGNYILSRQYKPEGRINVLVLGDPLEVISYEPVTNRLTTITFPLNTTIRGSYGYGEYEFQGLWNLAATKGNPAGIILESLTEEFGLPMRYYIGDKKNLWRKQNQTVISQLFSSFSLPYILQKKYETNISPLEFLAFTRLFKAPVLKSFELSVGNGLETKKSPDGNTYQVINREQFDEITQGIFEDLLVRQEGKKIAVYNTTGRVALGSRVGRIVSALGGHVVLIGNTTETVTTCELLGTQEELTSHTADALLRLFSCKRIVTEGEGQADLTVRVGSAYAEQFVQSDE